MKYLTDSEIINWNDRLSKQSLNINSNRIGVYPKSNSSSSHPHIIYKMNSHGGDFMDITEPITDFIFIFSVSLSRINEFKSILETVFKQKFGTKSIYEKSSFSKVCDIDVDESIIKSKKEDNHKLGDKEFIRFTYKFSGKLGSIIGYVSYLEDAINFLSLTWGYREDGSEVNLLKYPIGSIVSMKNNQSDYLVLDYNYEKVINDYRIGYVISEILEDKGTVVKYGYPFVVNELNINWSRNDRINNILKN
jgi:hypothetical protein